MLFLKHIPKFPLNEYVENIIYLEGNNKGAGFPKTNMSIVFNLEDSFKRYLDKDFLRYTDYKRYWVAGFQTKPTYVESYGESKMLVIQFKTLGAFAFLNQPLNYFLDEYISLDNVFGREVEETWEQLKEAGTIKEKFLLVENFLYRKLLTHNKETLQFLNAVNFRIIKGHKINITGICKEFKISRKHLNHLFKEKIGISPKLLSSLYRLQSTFKTIGAENSSKLTSIAYELDYFDQAHFNNDFKRFTDLTPSQYIKNTVTVPSLKIIPHFLPFEG